MSGGDVWKVIDCDLCVSKSSDQVQAWYVGCSDQLRRVRDGRWKMPSFIGSPYWHDLLI